MKPHEKRVLKERDELEDKLVKLESFLKTDAYLRVEQPQRMLLGRQANIMRTYLNILDQRIEAFAA